MAERIRIVLGDDHAVVLSGLRALFEAEPDFRVVATATDGEQLRRAVERCRPDVAVVDVKMPVMDGLSCLEHIRRTSPETKVLMLTAFADGPTLQAILRAGADGLLLKCDPPDQAVQGVRQVMAGALVFPAAARRWLGAGPRASASDPLSERESEVLALVAQGLSNREVADKLYVSENTVKFHLQNVFQRLAVSNRTEASRWFLRRQETVDEPSLPARLRLLVVEDEALVAEEIRDRLERLKVEVVAVADTGEQAIRLVGEAAPDLVLMDIRLKGELDGIEAAAVIRERFDVPVVYLTAHSDLSTLDRAMQGSPFGYVLKPFQEKDLRIAIASAVSRVKAEQHLKDEAAMGAATLAAVTDGVVAVDPRGRITFMSSAAESVSGWALHEARRKPVDEILPMLDPASRQAMESPASRALREPAPEQPMRDALLVDRRGVTIPVATRATPILDPKGRPSGALLLMRDLRQWQRVEEAPRTPAAAAARPPGR
jgi:PAS domain S-box-containing protein